MAKQYFHKEIRKNPVFNGAAPIKFEECGDNGLLVVDEEAEAPLLAALVNYIRNRQGGVRVISAERYAELKKNPVARARQGTLLTGGIRLAQEPSPMSRTGPPPLPKLIFSPESAPAAKEPAKVVVPVAGESLAQTVAEVASGEAFKPRVGKPRGRPRKVTDAGPLPPPEPVPAT